MNKVIILLLFGLVGFTANGQQRFPSGFPTQLNTGWNRWGYAMSDSGLIIANRDTTWFPKFSGTVVFRPTNKQFYWFDSTNLRWNLFGTNIDTTSLSNRINLKLNISDTTGKWLSQSTRLVDTMYRVNDSTVGYTIKGSSYTFQILGGSGGGGGGSGTVTSVGLSLPSAFNVVPSTITTSGTFNVTGAGTTAQYIRGNGTLATTDTGMIPNFYLKVRGLLTGTSPITFNQTTGAIGINNANTTGTKGAASFTSAFSDNGSGLIDLADIVATGSCTNCAVTYNAKGQATSYSSGVGPSGSSVDTIFRTPGIDSIYYTINSVQYAIKDSLGSRNISNASLTADGNYTQNWSNKQLYVDSIGGQFLLRMGGVGSTGTRRKEFKINWGGSSFGDQIDGYNVFATIKKADLSDDSLRLGLISSGTGVLSMGYYDVATPTNNSFISYSSLNGLININAKDSIWIKGLVAAATADSILAIRQVGTGSSYKVLKIPISAAGGGATLNNIGSGFRWVAAPSGNIKTVYNSNTILWDSTSNANGLTPKVDTSVIATQYDLLSSQQNIVDTVNKYLPLGSIYSNAYYFNNSIPDTSWRIRSDATNMYFDKYVPSIGYITKAIISIEDDIIVLDSVPFVGSTWDASGNSYTAGVGASPSSNAYVPLLETDMSMTANNDGDSGTGIMDVQFRSYRDYAPFGQSNRNPRTIMIGFNDYLKSTDGSKTQGMFSYAFRAVLFNFFLDTALASNDPGITTTGSWSTFDLSSSYPQKSKYLLSGAGRLSVASSAGDSKTYTFDGDNVGMVFFGANGTTQNYGRLKIEIDGLPVDTIDQNGIADDQTVFANSTTRTEDLISAAVVYTGLSNGSHTIKATLLDNVNTNIDAFGVMALPNQSQSLVMGSIQKLLSAGYTAMSAGTPKNDAGVDATNLIIQSVVNEFRLLGYPVVFNDVNAFTDPSTDIGVDNIHWNNAGHLAGKNSFRSKIIR